MYETSNNISCSIYLYADLVFLDEFKNQYSNAGGIEPQLLALKKVRLLAQCAVRLAMNWP